MSNWAPSSGGGVIESCLINMSEYKGLCWRIKLSHLMILRHFTRVYLNPSRWVWLGWRKTIVGKSDGIWGRRLESCFVSCCILSSWPLKPHSPFFFRKKVFMTTWTWEMRIFSILVSIGKFKGNPCLYGSISVWSENFLTRSPDRKSLSHRWYKILSGELSWFPFTVPVIGVRVIGIDQRSRIVICNGWRESGIGWGKVNYLSVFLDFLKNIQWWKSVFCFNHLTIITKYLLRFISIIELCSRIKNRFLPLILYFLFSLFYCSSLCSQKRGTDKVRGVDIMFGLNGPEIIQEWIAMGDQGHELVVFVCGYGHKRQS